MTFIIDTAKREIVVNKKTIINLKKITHERHDRIWNLYIHLSYSLIRVNPQSSMEPNRMGRHYVQQIQRKRSDLASSIYIDIPY